MNLTRQQTLLGTAPEGKCALIVGLGGLGAPAAQWLLRAGVQLRAVEGDQVSDTDLHRQVLYTGNDVGKPKAEAAQRLGISCRDGWFDESDLAGADVVLDCTDDPGSRFRIHAACVEAQTPLVWGAVEGWEGQWASVVPGGPCLRCLWPEPSDAPSCADVGITGPVTGAVGSHMALEALKILAGEPAGGVLHLLKKTDLQSIPFKARADCTCHEAK